MDPNCLTLMVLWKNSSKKLILKKKNLQTTKCMKNYLACKEFIQFTNCKVNLRLIVWHWTYAILFVGPCRVLSHLCIGQLCTSGWLEGHSGCGMQTTIGGRWFSHNVVHLVFEVCNVVPEISLNNNMSPVLGVWDSISCRICIVLVLLSPR